MPFESSAEYVFGAMGEELLVAMPWLSRQFARAPISAPQLARSKGEAPKLIIDGEGVVLPDWYLQLKGPLELPAGVMYPDESDTCRPQSFLVDAKSKDVLTRTHITGTLDTGFNERHWDDYRKIQEFTKEPVFLAFVHLEPSCGVEPFISFDSLDRLARAPWKDRAGRAYRGPRHGNFNTRTPGVFWPHTALTRIPLSVAGQGL